MKGLSYPPSLRKGKKPPHALHISLFTHQINTSRLQRSLRGVGSTLWAGSGAGGCESRPLRAAAYVNFDICNSLISHKKVLDNYR